MQHNATQYHAYVSELITLFFDVFHPQLAIVGQYAAELQTRLGSRSDTKSGDAWTSALTDADLGVQRYLEAYTLARFPQWYFYGEEHAHSDNTKYFDPSASVAVLLDPINGTRLYKDGADSYDILMSLRVDQRIVATISHMPAQQVSYLADRSHGCRKLITGNDTTSPLSVSVAAATNDNMTLATYQADALSERLPKSVHRLDMLSDYRADDPRCCLNTIFENELGGYLFRDCALLDVGATAFAVCCAGGIATKPDGSALTIFESFDPDHREDLLVCMNHRLHDETTNALSESNT